MFLRPLLAAVLAATVVPQSVEQLTDRSTHVVEAMVEGQQAAREEGPAGIYTRSTLRVLSTLKGQAAPRLVLRQPGGTLGNEQVKLPGDAALQPGEHVLAFLRCERGAAFCTLVGLAQGVYRLNAGLAARDFASTSFVMGPPLSPGPEPYAPLAARVRARAAETAR